MRGLVLIISAPSGGGKTSICKRLLQKHKNLRASISCTTRSPRAGERDGKHYFFLSRKQFQQKLDEGQFLEWAQVHDEWYGTPRAFVENVTEQGQDIVLAIDVQGAMSIRKLWPEAVLVFVLPPTWRALKGRLIRRRDAWASVEKRLKAAKKELTWAPKFDYCIVNDRLFKATRRVEEILASEKLRSKRQLDRLEAVMNSK
jgi:guanylate kinase